MATTPTPTFLKPTAVEPAGPAAKPPGGDSPQKNGRALRRVQLAVGVLVLLTAIAGGIYFAWHRWHKSGASNAAIKNPTEASSKNSIPQTLIDLPLEPFVVNLADAGGQSYVRIGLTLHLATFDDPKKSASAGNEAVAGGLRDMVRDQIINVLNQQHAADLLAPDGKEHLKQAISAAIAAKNPQLHVVDIYFTQFLVQS